MLTKQMEKEILGNIQYRSNYGGNSVWHIGYFRSFALLLDIDYCVSTFMTRRVSHDILKFICGDFKERFLSIENSYFPVLYNV